MSTEKETLEVADRETLFKLRSNLELLTERVGRLEAQAELVKVQSAGAKAQYEEFSRTISQKYNLVEGDSISVEDGAIVRAPQPEPPPAPPDTLQTAPEPVVSAE